MGAVLQSQGRERHFPADLMLTSGRTDLVTQKTCRTREEMGTHREEERAMFQRVLASAASSLSI